MRYLVIVCFFIVAGSAGSVGWDFLFPREKAPQFDRVNDYAHLLRSTAKDSINMLIEKLEREIGSQIAVITTDTLYGLTMDQYSFREATKMGIGRKGYDDGVLITVAPRDRQVRIEVGTGLENILRDEITSRYNREVMVPYFRNEEYGKGLYIGIDSICHLIIKYKHRIGERPTR